MEIDPTTALIPAEPSATVAFRAQREPGSGPPARSPKPREDFVFLGYGPAAGGELYDAAGRSVPPRNRPGSMVDLYA
jgi:hypothetical protein